MLRMYRQEHMKGNTTYGDIAERKKNTRDIFSRQLTLKIVAEMPFQRLMFAQLLCKRNLHKFSNS